MTLEKLERFMTPDHGASIGVLVSVQCGQDGTFEAASFEVAAEPSSVPPHAFHCSMSLAEGFWRAEHDLSRAAEDFWFAHEVTRRRSAHGRELAALTVEELEAISGYRRPVHDFDGSKHLNDAVLTEIAKNEREARCDESAHARMEAVAALAEAKEFLAVEALRASAWWDSLAPHDRSRLPHYDCKDLPTASRAIFTYRDFLEKSRKRLPGGTCRVDLGQLQAAKRSKRAGGGKSSARKVA
ncbi:hypothetical protein [Profundibacterium mesophilum]|nr:hypothetical protein [Profundibacterium mesophilum]